MPHSKLSDSLFNSRELSWLDFNERVLGQADAEEVPLLERLRFLKIFQDNLDEFFMVRAGSLSDRKKIPDLPPDQKTDLTAAEELSLLFQKAGRLLGKRDRIAEKLFSLLSEKQVRELSWKDLTKDEKNTLKKIFLSEFAPITSPFLIDVTHPFPHLAGKQSHLLLLLADKKQRGTRNKYPVGIVPIPEQIPKLLCVDRGEGLFYLRTEQLFYKFSPLLFPNYLTNGKLLFRVIRNADMEIADNFSDDPAPEINYPAYLKALLKKRERLSPVCLVCRRSEKKETSALREQLAKKYNLPSSAVYETNTPLDWGFVSTLISEASVTLPDGLYSPIRPIPLSFDATVTEEIRKRDLLLHYPYHSMRIYLDFLRESVFDPTVRAISITLYRLSPHSEIISLLCAAAENGKKVTAVVELKARFDEEKNIHWAERLSEAGCLVIYGMEGLKVHAKVTLVERTSGEKLVHIGTGNYNEDTAKLYTDLGLFTADERTTADAEELFECLTSGKVSDAYQTLLVAPTTLKETILTEIMRETLAARLGKPAYIRLKMNSMTDKDVIDALIKAGKSGVNIDLIIRGSCCLRAEIPGMTDHIHVTSIVGRYLEHARIFIFGCDENARVYMGSADLMTRNTTRRIEVITPILDKELAERLINITDLQLKDTVKASRMCSDGSYEKKLPPASDAPSGSLTESEPFDSQIALYGFYSSNVKESFGAS